MSEKKESGCSSNYLLPYDDLTNREILSSAGMMMTIPSLAMKLYL